LCTSQKKEVKMKDGNTIEIRKHLLSVHSHICDLIYNKNESKYIDKIFPPITFLYKKIFLRRFTFSETMNRIYAQFLFRAVKFRKFRKNF